MPRLACPRCGHKFGISFKSGKRRCKQCNYDWYPYKLPLHLALKDWKNILYWFIREQSSNSISTETGIEQRRVLRALLYVRKALILDVPDIFSGTVEVDETYMGGQWKNKKKKERVKGTKRGRGTKKQPVFGIYARKGFVWAELVDDVEANTLQPIISNKVKKGSVVCSDTWKGYTGIATRGYVHRMVEHGKGEYSDCKGTHINGSEPVQNIAGVLATAHILKDSGDT